MNSKNEEIMNNKNIKFLISVYRSMLSKSVDYFFDYLNKIDKENITDGTELYLQFKDYKLDKKIFLEYCNNCKKHSCYLQIHAPMLDNIKMINIYRLFKLYTRASDILGYKLKVTVHPISKFDSKEKNIEKSIYLVNKIKKYIENNLNEKVEILLENLDDLNYANNKEYRLSNERLGIEDVIKISNLTYESYITWDICHNILKEKYVNYSVISNIFNRIKNIHVSDIDNYNVGHRPYIFNNIDIKENIKYLIKNNYCGCLVSEIDLLRLKLESYEKEIEEVCNQLEKLKKLYNECKGH